MKKDEVLLNLQNAVVLANFEDALSWTGYGLKEGIPPFELITEGLSKGMINVGKKYEDGDYYVTDMILSSGAMNEALTILLPFLKKRKSKYLGKVVLGSVTDDIHDIGKNIVATMLIGVGFDVYDLGVNVSKEEFINKAIEVQADIVGASAFMSSTYLYQLDIKKALDEAGLTPKVKYIIGGGAVYRQWAREIGADGFANDALEAVNLCKSFVSAKGV
ncbi:MAG TPA: cobalamin-binding protein [Peptococcaceae bacterium]|jgi:methylmalonyl-CoA mutase cobalamin-binding domain/chain|nr:cobalamin-binding protein [Peptococcaceae bacterium]